MIDISSIVKIFDAKFEFENGKSHFIKRKKRNDISKDMGLSKYFKESEKRSLKDIDGRRVRAYTVGNRTVKNDGDWTTVYVGGKRGKLVSAYPQTRARFESVMKRDKGIEIYKE